MLNRFTGRMQALKVANQHRRWSSRLRKSVQAENNFKQRLDGTWKASSLSQGVTDQARQACVESATRCCPADMVRTGDRAADSVADLLPSSVPKGVGKIGLVGVGGLLTFWLLQKVDRCHGPFPVGNA